MQLFRVRRLPQCLRNEKLVFLKYFFPSQKRISSGDKRENAEERNELEVFMFSQFEKNTMIVSIFLEKPILYMKKSIFGGMSNFLLI